jgi:RNA-splicing ligase RtcB
MGRGEQCLAGRPSAASPWMTEGVECRKDADVIDETPAAYKSIEAVMAAQPILWKSSTRCAKLFA